MSDEKHVTIKKEAGLPSSILFEDDAASGFENVKTTSLALPILKLLQNGSGEAQRRNQNYVEGAEPGMLLNTVTKKLYDGAKENGHYILTVGQHYVLIVGDDGAEQALISMSSSQGKISRKWNSMMMSISLDGKNGPYTPPSFSHAYKLTTVLNSGKGNQWYGYNIIKDGPVSDTGLYERAKKFYTSLASK